MFVVLQHDPEQDRTWTMKDAFATKRHALDFISGKMDGKPPVRFYSLKEITLNARLGDKIRYRFRG